MGQKPPGRGRSRHNAGRIASSVVGAERAVDPVTTADSERCSASSGSRTSQPERVRGVYRATGAGWRAVCCGGRRRGTGDPRRSRMPKSPEVCTILGRSVGVAVRTSCRRDAVASARASRCAISWPRSPRRCLAVPVVIETEDGGDSPRSPIRAQPKPSARWDPEVRLSKLLARLRSDRLGRAATSRVRGPSPERKREVSCSTM